MGRLKRCEFNLRSYVFDIAQYRTIFKNKYMEEYFKNSYDINSIVDLIK